MRQVATTCYSAVLEPLGRSIDTYCGLNGCVKIDVGVMMGDKVRVPYGALYLILLCIKTNATSGDANSQIEPL